MSIFHSVLIQGPGCHNWIYIWERKVFSKFFPAYIPAKFCRNIRTQYLLLHELNNEQVIGYDRMTPCVYTLSIPSCFLLYCKNHERRTILLNLNLMLERAESFKVLTTFLPPTCHILHLLNASQISSWNSVITFSLSSLTNLLMNSQNIKIYNNKGSDKNVWFKVNTHEILNEYLLLIIFTLYIC